MNENQNTNTENKMVNVSFESLIFPNKILPPCFFNSHISENLQEIYNQYDNDKIFYDNFEWDENDECIKRFYGYKDVSTRVVKGVEPIVFTAEKPSGGSRKFSVAHPLVQIPLHKYILENVDILLSKQVDETDDYCSNSHFFFEDGELYVEYDYNGNELISSGLDTLLQNTYRDSLIKKHVLSKGKYYKLSSDISNFYHSIYTHTISWDVPDTEKHIFDNLDIMMRTQNNNETKGIIIGPYSSGLFAELLMSKVDKVILKYINDNELDVSFVRFADDIEMYSDSEPALKECLFVLENELLKYKLDINNNKTIMSEFPFLQSITKNTKSIYQLKDRLIDNQYIDQLEKAEDIILEINNSIKVNYSNAKYLLNIINSLIRNKDIISDIDDVNILNILLDYLLNIIFKYPFLIQSTALVILSILEKSEVANIGEFITKAINKRNTKKQVVKEIIDIWITYIITYFEYNEEVTDSYFKEILYKSELSAVMIFNYYSELELLGDKKHILHPYLVFVKEDLKNKYADNWKQASWLSKYWLLFYMNDLKWNIHNIAGYGDTILPEINIESLTISPPLTTRLYLFLTMKNIGIELLDYSKIDYTLNR